MVEGGSITKTKLETGKIIRHLQHGVHHSVLWGYHSNFSFLSVVRSLLVDDNASIPKVSSSACDV